jgi:hypothetical protein
MTSESHIPMATRMDLKVPIGVYAKNKPSKVRGALKSKVGALI